MTHVTGKSILENSNVEAGFTDSKGVEVQVLFNQEYGIVIEKWIAAHNTEGKFRNVVPAVLAATAKYKASKGSVSL